MAISIVATAGSASANSFATLAEFEAFMDGRLNSGAFDDASADEQRRALVEATREITLFTYEGRTVTSTQALNWPRQWARDPDSPTADYYASTVVPQRVKDATCELAFQFLKAGTTDVAALDPTRNVKRKKVDVLETEYFDAHDRVTGLARYPSVLRYLRPLLHAPAKRKVWS